MWEYMSVDLKSKIPASNLALPPDGWANLSELHVFNLYNNAVNTSSVTVDMQLDGVCEELWWGHE